MLSIIETTFAALAFLPVFSLFLFNYYSTLTYLGAQYATYSKILVISAKLQQMLYVAGGSAVSIAQFSALLNTTIGSNYSVSQVSLSNTSQPQLGCQAVSRIAMFEEKMYMIKVCV